VSCESTLGIFDAHVSFQHSAELERPEGDVPHPVVDLCEADLCTGAWDRDVHPLPILTEAAIGADVPHLKAVGVWQWRQLMGRLPR
jgi:hypothetical protein